MGNFTKTIENIFHFDGDDILVRMYRLKRKDALKLMPFISRDDETGEVTFYPSSGAI